MKLSDLIVLTPLNITIAIVLLLGVIFHYLLYVRAIRENQILYKKLIIEAKKRATQSFSVVVELDRRAENIFPLLDSLEAQDYKKLQIVVIIKHTAGKNAFKLLSAYKRKSKSKLTLVRHRRGMNTETIITRYATGRYFIRLTPGMRVSPNFFVNASYATLVSPNSIITPRQLDRPGRTLLSGFMALRTVWLSTFGQLRSRPFVPSTLEGVIFKTKPSTKDSHAAGHVLNERLYINLQRSAMLWPLKLRSALVSIFAYLAFGVGVLFSYVFFNDDTVTVTLLVVFLLALVSQIIFQASLRGYRFIDHLNLFLLTPLSPVYHFLISVGCVLKQVFIAVRR